MKIEFDTAARLYQTGSTSTNISSDVKKQEDSKQDTVEISKEGLDAANEQNSDKSYDLDKVLQLHKKGFEQMLSKEESDYYWNARRSDPALDRALYDSDKADALKDIAKVQGILLKAVSGQKLTPEEEKMVREDPMLQQEIAKRQAMSQQFEQ